ncbi:outer membrane protein OprM precursor [mine drainage metagenome]|uniref:Outer membrane protein OprM n=1 Tax=mine drainage metagenome TaxID=410659 RepID=A0A1J5SIH7_9ZZZZ
MKSAALFLAPAALLIAGCTLAPRYERPAMPVANQWPAAAQAAAAAPMQAARQLSADADWTQVFVDPRLRALIRLALANNRDLRVATLTVQQVRARYSVANLALIPTLDATANGSRTRTALDDLKAGQPQTASHYGVGLLVPSYELDLFGRVQSLRTQALEQYLATEQAQRAAALSLVSEVATQYFAQREIAGQLRLAETTQADLESSLKVIRKQYQVGAASRLDLTTAQAEVQNSDAVVAGLRQQLAQANDALAFLVGTTIPADLPPAPSLDQPGLLADVNPGLPSSLLERRPDILQAEHLLKAANADVGAARAAFFPSISLTASAGTASPELSHLFRGGNGTWSFAPSITLPIFAAGVNKANLQIANLQKQIEVATYERAIQGAFRDVSDSLVARAQIAIQVAAYDGLVATERERLRLAQARYDAGVDSYLTLLTARRDLYAAQQNQLAAHFARYTNLVDLYRALGGSWAR